MNKDDKAIAAIDAHLRSDSISFAQREMHDAQMQALERRCMTLELEKANLQVGKLQAELESARANPASSKEMMDRCDAMEEECDKMKADIAELQARPSAGGDTDRTVDASILNRLTALEMHELSESDEGGGNYRVQFDRRADNRIVGIRMPERGMTIELQRDGADQLIGAVVSSSEN